MFLQFTPAPTPTSAYPPSIDLPGSTFPLIWGAVLLVLIILIAVAWSSREYREHEQQEHKQN